MKHTFFLTLAFFPILTSAQTANPYLPDFSSPAKKSRMKLVFSEEFNYIGKPDSAIWNYETGFQRNEELQWYQADNANCKDGRLLIEGKKADFPNPNYCATDSCWQKNRKTINYTSSSITTTGKRAWKYGRFEVRARVDTAMGAWPAIWLLGENQEWPSCGEIDMLEFYRPDNIPTILANVACGTDMRWKAKWDSYRKPIATLRQTDKDWSRKYHVWSMDWNKDSINLYIDDLLLNTTLQTDMVNANGSQPFLQPQYLLLNLALGSNGGDPSQSTFPITFEVDYVRVYQLVPNNK